MKTSQSLRTASARRSAPQLTILEDRLTPALAFQFDYSLDTTGYFNDPIKRDALERAGSDLTSRITSTPGAITPSGTGSWQAIFSHPVTGNETKIANLNIPAGTMVIYVGGANLPGSQAGEGGPGGYFSSGTKAFQTTVATRGQSGFASWGGSLTMDTDRNWYFGADANGKANGQVDFHTVAVHELSHAIGLGTTNEWDALVKNGTFTGSVATQIYGSAPKLSSDLAHFAQGTKSNGQPVSLQPTVDGSQRVSLSELDYAALADLGWQIAGLPSSANSAGNVGTAAPPRAPDGAPSIDGGLTATASQITVVTGPDGTVQIYAPGADGQLAPAGNSFKPFADFNGPVRAVAADVNGDKIADIVVGTGPNGGSRIRVIDGKTFQDLTASFSAFEGSYTGGVFLAAGDFNGDGRDEVIVTPDQGGGARVKVLSLNGNAMTTVADFYGINDPAFRGGARAAVGDINGDGTPDLVVAAGFGGGPRVSIIDGKSVLTGNRTNIGGDFFAFEQGLRNGVYITVGDVNGDGYGDLVFGAGPGGGPRVMTISGQTFAKNGSGAAVANPLGNTFAGDANQRGGVRVTTKDLDNSGKDTVITGSGTGGEVRVLAPSGNTTKTTLNPFGSSASLDGVYVG